MKEGAAGYGDSTKSPPIREFVEPPRPLAITSGEQRCASAVRSGYRLNNQQQEENAQGNDNIEQVNDSDNHDSVVVTQDKGKGKRWHVN